MYDKSPITLVVNKRKKKTEENSEVVYIMLWFMIPAKIHCLNFKFII